MGKPLTQSHFVPQRSGIAGNGAGDANDSALALPCVEDTHFKIAWSLDRASDVGRALLAATRRLREAGIDTAQLDSAVLLGYVLGVNKAWLYAHPTRLLSEIEIARFQDLVQRRMCAEPVAYLVGFKPFYGLEITVDRRVLIPRPETEVLVERVLAYLRQLAREERSLRVADVGTGSGAIALALAVTMPGLTVYATDVSDDALAVASQNVWRYGVGDQVQLLPGHLIEPLPEPVDVVVANLPYIPTDRLPHLPPQVRDYEPVIALDGGPDGLRVIAALLEMVASPSGRAKLQPDASIFLEIGADQGEAVRDLVAEILPGAQVEIRVDYSGLDRIAVITLGAASS